jgi:hypothetical protein
MANRETAKMLILTAIDVSFSDNVGNAFSVMVDAVSQSKPNAFIPAITTLIAAREQAISEVKAAFSDKD